ncbi:hypothetical protein C8B47_30270, partial [filamentous cyanobacterium CCP4]
GRGGGGFGGMFVGGAIQKVVETAVLDGNVLMLDWGWRVVLFRGHGLAWGDNTASLSFELHQSATLKHDPPCHPYSRGVTA